MQKKIYARGGNVLKAIQYLGSNGYGLYFYGLETVITLFYYKFGWRFVASCGAVSESEVVNMNRQLKLYMLF